ncbi:MAG: hypothetical protein JW910_14115 [Anaerolineae bacterium]|nr:hypothetical protein [Anaerolineae bacterium]
MSQIIVRIDDRIRLMSALLAATSWPDDEQQRKPHGTHAHARGTRKRVLLHNKHAAVLILQALLDRGVPLEAVFTYALKLEWPGLSGAAPPPWVPPTWPRHLLNFYEQVELATWWEEEAQVWANSQRESERVIEDAAFRDLLKPFVGEFDDALVFLPNVCYPTDSEIGVRANGELCCIAPPRIAWGDNPPWPFDEDVAHICRGALTQYGRLLMRKYLHQYEATLAEVTQKKLPVTKAFSQRNPSWEEQFLELFVVGLVAIYLEDAVNKQEARAYVLMQKKAHGLEILPGVVSVLRRYLNGHEDGQYAGFVEYLPYFGTHLRVAKTITAL